MIRSLIFIPLLSLTVCCSQKTETLPFLGNHTEETENGKSIVKKYFEVPDFKMVNQEGVAVTNETFKGKIYIADFIFLRCPTICPIMNVELKRVHDYFKNDKDILFVSYTIDPENDSIPVLKAYADRLGVKVDKWHFLHGDKHQTYDLAEKGYFAQAYDDAEAPGGYAHSGGFILVDQNRHIRGVYDGTNTEDVNRLIKEIVILQRENQK